MSNSPHLEVEERAEALVIGGVLERRRAECSAEASAELVRAVKCRLSGVSVWLDACARLSAHEAAPIVLAILESTAWPEEVRLAAMDAARSVAYETPLAARTAERLIVLADATLASHPPVAARALMGAVNIDNARGIGWLSERLNRWAPEHLGLSMERAARIVSRTQPSDRPSDLRYRELRDQAWRLEAKLRPAMMTESASSDDDRFAYASLLELLAVLAPFAPLPEMVDVLIRVYGSPVDVVLAGAASAMWILIHEHPDAERLADASPNGEALLASARTAPVPHAYCGKEVAGG